MFKHIQWGGYTLERMFWKGFSFPEFTTGLKSSFGKLSYELLKLSRLKLFTSWMPYLTSVHARTFPLEKLQIAWVLHQLSLIRHYTKVTLRQVKKLVKAPLLLSFPFPIKSIYISTISARFSVMHKFPQTLVQKSFSNRQWTFTRWFSPPCSLPSSDLMKN